MKRFKRLIEGVIAPFQSKVIILLYHRIFETSSDPQLLCVKPKHFAEHLEYLQQNYQVLSLSELENTLKRKQLPKRAVVITFDDGYVDNLLNAKPLLKRYGIPATVFVVTGYLGKEFWWDELEELVLSSSMLPEYLKITVNGDVYEWRVGDNLTTQEEWNIECSNDPSSRYKIYRDLYWLIRPLDSKKREAILDQLRSQVDVNKNYELLKSRAMTPDEIRMLTEGELIEIGAHTETHPVLSTLPWQKQFSEILNSKLRLEEIAGQPINAFSYPYGAKADIGRDTVKIVREAGFTLACANIPGTVTQGANLLFLPRYIVRDWEGDVFGEKLRKWFGEK